MKRKTSVRYNNLIPRMTAMCHWVNKADKYKHISKHIPTFTFYFQDTDEMNHLLPSSRGSCMCSYYTVCGK